MNIGFYLRDANSKTAQRIWAIFRHNGERLKIDTHKKIEPKDWSTAKQSALSGFKHSKEYNKYLKEFKENIEKTVLALDLKKVRIDQIRLQDEIDKIYKKDELKIGTEEIIDFISFINSHINAKKNIAPSTVSMFKQVKMHVLVFSELVSKKQLAEYNKLGNKSKSKYEFVQTRLLDFDQINSDYVERFKDYLFEQTFETTIRGEKQVVHYKKNYIAKLLARLKHFTDAASQKGLIAYFKPNQTSKIDTEDIDSVYTDFEMLERWIKLKLPNKEEQIVRDKYFFNCFLGMRFSDLNNLEKHFFTERKIKGETFIVYSGRSKKTDRRQEFIVHKNAVSILQKYDFEMPKVSEQNYNELLKQIAYKAGFTKLVRIRETRGNEQIFSDVPEWQLISSHTGRRSFCTNFYNEGVATQAIMSISGHKTEREFLKYINKDAGVKIEVIAEQVNNIRLNVA